MSKSGQKSDFLFSDNVKETPKIILLRTVVTVVWIALRSFVGMFLTKITEYYKETIMQGAGLTVTLTGLQNALRTDSVIIDCSCSCIPRNNHIVSKSNRSIYT